MISDQQNSYITAHLDYWTEYSEENKKYSQTTVHTKVLEAMFPKKGKSKTHKFCSNHIMSARSIFIEWINKWMNEEYMQTCKKKVFHLSHSSQLTHLIWKKKVTWKVILVTFQNLSKIHSTSVESTSVDSSIISSMKPFPLISHI